MRVTTFPACQTVGMYDLSPEAADILRRLVAANTNGLLRGLPVEGTPKDIINELLDLKLTRPISGRAFRPTPPAFLWAAAVPA